MLTTKPIPFLAFAQFPVSTCHKDIAYLFVVRFISFRLDALQSSSCHITRAFFEECFFMSCSCFQRAGRGSLKFIRCASRPPLLLLLLHFLVLQLLNRKLQTERARPDFNCEGHISMGIVGPQPQTQDLSGHCRTSTASCRQSGPGRISTAKAIFQWALSDLNHGHRISVGSS